MLVQVKRYIIAGSNAMAAITLLQANLKQLKVAASNVSADPMLLLCTGMSTITTIIMGNFVIIGNYCSQINNDHLVVFCCCRCCAVSDNTSLQRRRVYWYSGHWFDAARLVFGNLRSQSGGGARHCTGFAGWAGVRSRLAARAIHGEYTCTLKVYIYPSFTARTIWIVLLLL